MSLAGLGREWLFIGHGWPGNPAGREMEWSTHCNAEVVRWVFREHGVTLTGPDPKELLAEVPAEVLRTKMRALVETFLPDLFSWISFDVAWAQRYAVTTLCGFCTRSRRASWPRSERRCCGELSTSMPNGGI